MKRLFAVVAALALAGAGLSSAEAAPVGSAEDVEPSALVRFEQVEGPILAGAEIFIGQRIVTGETGQVEIRFADDTRLVVGPNSSLLIEDYLVRNDGSAGNIAINALGGAFRFITGNSPKDRYAINTPTGTIGVRGTEFDLLVGIDGVDRMLLYSGAADLCTLSGACSAISDPCALGELSSDGSRSLGYTGDYDKAERKALKAGFIYSATQKALSRDFRIKNATYCLRTGGNLADEMKPDLPTSVEGAPAGGIAGPSAAPPPVGEEVVPEVPLPLPPPPPVEEDDDCAGNSTPNPGNSQNCSH